jgi:hypothetical protein
MVTVCPIRFAWNHCNPGVPMPESLERGGNRGEADPESVQRAEESRQTKLAWYRKNGRKRQQ